MSGAVVVTIVPPAYTPPLLTEAKKFEQTFMGPFKIPGDILFDLALNGYSTLAELVYFGHKDFEYLFSAKIIQALNRDFANYSDKGTKLL